MAGNLAKMGLDSLIKLNNALKAHTKVVILRNLSIDIKLLSKR